MNELRPPLAMYSFFWGVVVPALYIMIVLACDYVIPNGLITPFFVTLGLLIMALLFRPAQMIPWAIIYTAIVCGMYVSPKLYELFSGHPPHEGAIMHWLRAVTYLMVGVISSYLCVSLNSLRQHQQELFDVLSKLPWPILVSDHQGRVVFWNLATLNLFPHLQEKNNVVSYFDLLSSPERQGQTISNYMQRMESAEQSKFLELQLNGRPIRGYTKILEWANKTVLLTVLADEGCAKEGLCFSGLGNP